jgi:hypothetical protein
MVSKHKDFPNLNIMTRFRNPVNIFLKLYINKVRTEKEIGRSVEGAPFLILNTIKYGPRKFKN